MGIIIICFMGFTHQLFEIQLPFIIKDIMQCSANYLGYASASVGTGMIITSFIIYKIKLKNTLLFMMSGMFLESLVSLSMFLNSTYPHTYTVIIDLILFGLLGAFFTIVLVPFQIYLMKKIPADYIGRVSGVLNGLFGAAATFGMLSGGILSMFYTVLENIIIQSGLYILGSIIVFTIYNLNIKKIKPSEEESKSPVSC